MPPENSAQEPTRTPRGDSSSGPVAGIVIIVLLMLFGALYYWGQWQGEHEPQAQTPALPSESLVLVATTTIISTTTASTTAR